MKPFIIIDEEIAAYLKKLRGKYIIVKNKFEAEKAVKKVFKKANLILTSDKVYFWVKSFLDFLMKKNYPLIIFPLKNKTLKEKAELIKNLILKLD
jgi:hypothetical protein